MTQANLYPPAGEHQGVMVWQLPPSTAALSSAPVGGGSSEPSWLVNIGVDRNYRRTDLDAHVAEIATQLGLAGPGVGLLTAARIDHARRGDFEGVSVDATVGVSKPVWAADPEGGWNTTDPQVLSPAADVGAPLAPGTINTVVHVPVQLGPGAAVNAVFTATEAKTQALIE